jgi:hypothetical protein
LCDTKEKEKEKEKERFDCRTDSRTTMRCWEALAGWVSGFNYSVKFQGAQIVIVAHPHEKLGDTTIRKEQKMLFLLFK